MIIASLTTMKQRELSLMETVYSLLPQVDRLNVYLHGYSSIPEFLVNDKIEVVTDVEYGDHGDLDKFFWVDRIKEEDFYHFLCDDDLIYPPDYVSEAIAGLERAGKSSIASFHGSVPYRLPIANYYQDRYQFPCLGTVTSDQRVSIIGTGVMFYHSSAQVKEFLKSSMKANMADIYFAIWAGDNDKLLYVLTHEEGWIKHSPHVKAENTIFAWYVNNPYDQTTLVNSRPDLFKIEIPVEYPLVSIVVINSRLKSNPNWLQRCYDSIRAQSYPNIEPIIITNESKLMTIGKAFNDGVRKAKGKYVLFLADDDYISASYVSDLVTLAEDVMSEDKMIVQATSFLTMFQQLKNEEAERTEPRELVPTGMWLRQYCLDNPFVEFLTRYVDTEYMERAKANGYKQAVAYWNYGYFYRSHPGQASGGKAMIGAHESGDATERAHSEMIQTVPELVIAQRGLQHYEAEIRLHESF